MGRSRKAIQHHTRQRNRTTVPMTTVPMTTLPMRRVAQIQSREAKGHGGMVAKGSRVARLQSRLAKYILANQRRVCKLRNGCRRTPMRPDAVARIMRATSKRNGGIIPKRSFAARAQRAAARNCHLTK